MSHYTSNAMTYHYARIGSRVLNLLHPVSDSEKLRSIAESMRNHGWQGAPIVVIGDTVYVGNHRAVAAMIADVEPEVHEISVVNPDGSEEIDDLAWALAQACDTDELLQYARALQQHGAIDDYSVRLLELEVAKEYSAR
jgi:ParB-like chromosome segregation protein Spo0J